jgi:hypothetical protein
MASNSLCVVGNINATVVDIDGSAVIILQGKPYPVMDLRLVESQPPTRITIINDLAFVVGLPDTTHDISTKVLELKKELLQRDRQLEETKTELQVKWNLIKSMTERHNLQTKHNEIPVEGKASIDVMRLENMTKRKNFWRFIAISFFVLCFAIALYKVDEEHMNEQSTTEIPITTHDTEKVEKEIEKEDENTFPSPDSGNPSDPPPQPHPYHNGYPKSHPRNRHTGHRSESHKCAHHGRKERSNR